MPDFNKYFNLEYMMNHVKKIVIVKKWYLGSKLIDIDTVGWSRDILTSDDDFKHGMAFILGAMSMLKLSRGVAHEATGMHIFDFDAVDLDKRGRKLKVEMYYIEY